jgi:hypothetical protein
MRFLSKITFICNCCFVTAVLLLLAEKDTIPKGPYNGALELQPMQSTIAILGYGAIVLNIFFGIRVLYRFIIRKPQRVRLWLILVNLVFIPIQLYYFLF